jgi:hypothetical protein
VIQHLHTILRISHSQLDPICGWRCETFDSKVHEYQIMATAGKVKLVHVLKPMKKVTEKYCDINRRAILKTKKVKDRDIVKFKWIRFTAFSLGWTEMLLLFRTMLILQSLKKRSSSIERSKEKISFAKKFKTRSDTRKRDECLKCIDERLGL